MNIKKKCLSIWYKMPLKLFLKNSILFESNPDFSDNPKFVFDELIKRKINKKYKLIWIVKDRTKFEDININNVFFINRRGNFFERIKYVHYYLTAKYILDCNEYIKKSNKNQYRIHLTHGLPIKVSREYLRGVGETDAIINSTKFFMNIYTDYFNVGPEKILNYGLPRDDVFYKKNKKRQLLFPNIKRKKTIIWMPTYRNHKAYNDSSDYRTNISFKYGVPCIDNENELIELNDKLNSYDFLLIIKLHPAEEHEKISNLNLSNIKLFDNNIYNDNHTNIYDYLPYVDALITDYSSVYYDFLFSKKPIGLAIPDINEYKKHFDIVYDDFEANVVGNFIYNYNDLITFFDNLSNNKDLSFKKRMKKIKKYNDFDDGKSTKRIADLLEMQMNRKK